jgi:hypothetical protein
MIWTLNGGEFKDHLDPFYRYNGMEKLFWLLFSFLSFGFSSEKGPCGCYVSALFASIREKAF